MPTNSDRDILIALGKRLAAFRRAADLSQEKLAEAAEVAVSYVGHLEIGSRQPTISVLRRLAGALGIPMWRLLTDDDTSAGSGGPTLSRELAEAVDGLSDGDTQLLIAMARRIRGSRTVKRNRKTKQVRRG